MVDLWSKTSDLAFHDFVFPCHSFPKNVSQHPVFLFEALLCPAFGAIWSHLKRGQFGKLSISFETGLLSRLKGAPCGWNVGSKCENFHTLNFFNEGIIWRQGLPNTGACARVEEPERALPPWVSCLGSQAESSLSSLLNALLQRGADHGPRCLSSIKRRSSESWLALREGMSMFQQEGPLGIVVNARKA